MAFENMIMGDARKLEKLFTPYNEVIKGQKNQCQSIKQRTSNQSHNQSSVNQFYKFQSANSEHFIDNRDLIPSSNGLAILKDVRNTLEDHQ
ncbi:hypothetical protein ALC56_10578 [Trachymyrmex septentrionalis]|uniref:Uncharacterized protein n=1 Tax=Trachymyrmex septentrionalis TaxID=34720 RepID=A0A195F3S2_9HYME|nr:hypothetical protein ALC56_10578 [Trachymyrmex septentrionalis]